ncbi:MAG TPA: SET domain-containing protein-lysine N-methyltransferase, partial [Planctomycetota bacterium]|nr:SET domain-containing protein-lysine N-methyltransferase [Planctomycetota bacterium]
LSELPIELQRRVYQWSELAGDPHSRYRALVFGFGSLYNHDTPANLLYRPDVEQQAMVYRAARAIAADEELTIDYCAEAPGGEPGDPERINFDWFRRFGIDKH